MPDYKGLATDDITQINALSFKGGATLRFMTKVAASFTPASVAAAITANQTVNVAGVLPGDAIFVTPPSITAGVAPVAAFCATAGVVTVVFSNNTAGALVPAAGNYVFSVMR